jgi:selenium-binding protein 1
VPRTSWKPDPTFYPSPSLASEAAPERLAYVATFWRGEGEPQPDGPVAHVDVEDVRAEAERLRAAAWALA